MVFTVSMQQLSEFARQFWSGVRGAKVFAFHGAMGAGKTTVIAALCRQKGVKDVIGSPTFSIINEYQYTENGIPKKIYNLDLFRLNSMEKVVRAGVEDCIYSGEICLLEWAEKAPELFDEDTVHVYIEPLTESSRRIKIESSAA